MHAYKTKKRILALISSYIQSQRGNPVVGKVETFKHGTPALENARILFALVSSNTHFLI